MTDLKHSGMGTFVRGFTEAPFTLEMRKGKRGGIISVGNVVSVAELSEDKIELLSRGGRMSVGGEGLTLSVFEERSVEIAGKIMSIEIQYGRAGKK